MKQHSLLCVLIWLCLCPMGIMAQQKGKDFKPANLAGIWQMYFYVSDSPDIPGELHPGNSFKVLSEDGHITNFRLLPGKGSFITGEGTYEQIADNQYAEHIKRSIHLPVLNGKTNVLTFELKDDRLLRLKFYIEKDKDGNLVDTWYHETWVRCVMPEEWPE